MASSDIVFLMVVTAWTLTFIGLALALFAADALFFGLFMWSPLHSVEKWLFGKSWLEGIDDV